MGGGGRTNDELLYNNDDNNSINHIKKMMIDKIQLITISSSLMRRLRKLYYYKSNHDEYEQTMMITDDGSGTSTSNDKNPIYIIQGLEHVFIKVPGDSCADSVRICGYQPYRYIWYMISGSSCDVIQFIMTLFIHYVLLIDDPTICWTIGFILSIVFRHTFHRYLVFGNYVGGYYSSLLRMYAAYSIIILLSTIFHYIIHRLFPIHFVFIFIITLIWTGVVNYFILKKIWSFTGK